MHFNHGITITCHNKANITSDDDAHLKLIVRVGGLILVKDGLLDDLSGLSNLVLDARGSGGLLGHAVSLDTLGGGLLLRCREPVRWYRDDGPKARCRVRCDLAVSPHDDNRS